MAKELDIESSKESPVAITTPIVATTTTTTLTMSETIDNTAVTDIPIRKTSPSLPIMTLTINTSNDENATKRDTEESEMHDTKLTTNPSAQKDKMETDPSLINFKVLYVLMQLCGLTMIVLVGSWVNQHLGGLAGSDNPKLEFNWHPLLMTIGFIYLYGNSILIYRGFRTTRKKTLKLTHAVIHLGALILTVLGSKAAYDSHTLAVPPIPNLYSLHSWLGLSAIILFILQYIAGFIAFLSPGLKDHYKVALMPFHIYFGLFGFILSIASALMGITEKFIFSIPQFSALPPGVVLANIIGVLYVIFGALVVYLATEHSYKRKPIPEDTALLASSLASE